MRPLPPYEGEPSEFLLQLSYWLRDEGAPLATVLAVERAAEDLLDLDCMGDD
jgi:hypothetical protein